MHGRPLAEESLRKPHLSLASAPDARPLFICEIEQLGGAERSILGLSRWLSERGLDNYILTYFDHCNIAQYADHSLRVVALNPEPGVFGKIKALRKHLKSRPTHALMPACSGYQPSLHATLAGCRGFHTIMHDTPSLFVDKTKSSLKEWVRITISNRIIGLGLRSGGKTIVNSEYLKAECRRDFGISANIVRMGGLYSRPKQKMEKRVFGPGKPFSILSVSRIEGTKRIDWMIRALHHLESNMESPLEHHLSDVVDWRLDIVGKGPLISELTNLARTLNISDRVRFHGFVADVDLQAFYDQADLFLMPAVQGYGIPALESLQRGVPVLLHRESGVSDILLDTPWAFVFDGSESYFVSSLALAIDNVVKGRHYSVPCPHLPTEDEWSERAATLFGWL